MGVGGGVFHVHLGWGSGGGSMVDYVHVLSSIRDVVVEGRSLVIAGHRAANGIAEKIENVPAI